MANLHESAYGPSPTSSPDQSKPDLGGLYDEDANFADENLDGAESKPKKSGRRGPGAVDKRATHNAIERARRESLNGRFMTLAEALPGMANVKRPSKSIIVNKALDFVFEAQVKEHALVTENNELRREVDQLRARLGMSPLSPPAPLPHSSRTMSNAPAALFTTYSPHSHSHNPDEFAASIHGSSRGSASPPSQSPPCEGQIHENYVALPSPPSTEGRSPSHSYALYHPTATSNSSFDENNSVNGGVMTPDSLVLENDLNNTKNDGAPKSTLPSSFLTHSHPHTLSHPHPSHSHNGATAGRVSAVAQGQAMLQQGFGYIQNPSLLAQQQQTLLHQLQHQQQQQHSMQNHEYQQLQQHQHLHQHQQQQQQQKLFSLDYPSAGGLVGAGGAGGGGQLGAGANNWGAFGGMDSYSFMS